MGNRWPSFCLDQYIHKNCRKVGQKEGLKIHLYVCLLKQPDDGVTLCSFTGTGRLVLPTCCLCHLEGRPRSCVLGRKYFLETVEGMKVLRNVEGTQCYFTSSVLCSH